MNKTYNYVTIDNPNTGLLDSETSEIPFGQYIPSPLNPSVDDELATAVKSFDMYLPNFSLREYKGRFDRQAILQNNNGIGLDMLGICLILKGHVKTFVDAHEACGASYNFSQNFKYDPRNEFKHFIAAGKPFHIAHFEVKPDYFMQFLPKAQWADSLINVFEKKDRISGKQFMPILSAQERAMQNILDCPFEGKLAYMMLEASMIQIILLQFHAMFAGNAAPSDGISARDKELIFAVKQYLDENFLHDHSLTSLSKHFGANINKLMTLFRTVFGDSIFDHLANKRMVYAQQLLLDQRPICEVARIVGYKNPNHFSTAFRKKYGYRPSQVRR